MDSFITKNRLYLLPIFLLVGTRLGIELFVELFPVRFAWIPSFIWYWALIYLCFKWGREKEFIGPVQNSFSIRPWPSRKWLVLGILLPALLPIGVFINVTYIPVEFLLYILIFACINPWFEELIWRHSLSFLPSKKWIVVLYSAGLFAFSHYFFWQYWFTTPEVMIPTVISTFIMGVLWMLFLLREQKYIYIVISHILVDIFNLSVAVYYGIDIWHHTQNL